MNKSRLMNKPYLINESHLINGSYPIKIATIIKVLLKKRGMPSISQSFIVSIALLFLAAFIGFIIAYLYFKSKMPKIREEAIKQSRAVLSGQFSEQLAPFLPDFPYKPTEARFIGKPIDFIVFKGLDEKATEEIVFVEVKSGKSKTSPTEKKVKEAVEQKKVKWEEYRVPEKVTKAS